MVAVSLSKQNVTPKMAYYIRHFSSIVGKRYATRFAPAPSGYLHLGHIASASYVWVIAKLCEAKTLLRIEDHDRQRAKPEFEQAIIEDLAYFDWKDDFGLSDASYTKQRDHEGSYSTALALLKTKTKVYACNCTRKHLESCFASQWLKPNEKRYLGICKGKNYPEKGAVNIRAAFRATSYRIEDGYLGLLEQSPARTCGDLLIRDKNGLWTYNFSTVVDNINQNIDLIIRGLDLAHCCARQIQLAELLGHPQRPAFFHHPLIVDPDSRKKLSKRFLSTSVRSLIKQGWSAEKIIGKACFLSGLTQSDRPLVLDQLLEELRS